MRAVVVALILSAQIAMGQDQQADGLVVSKSQIVISSQVSAPITEMPVRNGQAFLAGEVLVRFDCAILEAQRDAQAERQIAADLNAASLERLNRSGAAGRTETLLAQSEAKVAAAEFRAINAQLKGCVITAPFKGRMVETFVSTFENVGETQELIEIVDDQNLEIELIVPSNWLQWLSAGTGFDFRVFETGDVRPAEITRIGAIVDPVSRTAKVFARFDDLPGGVLAGMTGTAMFPQN